MARLKSRHLTIGRLAAQCGLSRSTLLYYDSIGLLPPSGRSRANYRLYSGRDIERLQLISMYRQMGLSMSTIREILESGQCQMWRILEKRLAALGKEIASLREQQHVIIRMLGDSSLRRHIPVMDKDSWIQILRAAGLDDQGMLDWHREFERFSPELHQEFLRGLGISAEKTILIRQLSAPAEGSDPHAQIDTEKHD